MRSFRRPTPTLARRFTSHSREWKGQTRARRSRIRFNGSARGIRDAGSTVKKARQLRNWLPRRDACSKRCRAAFNILAARMSRRLRPLKKPLNFNQLRATRQAPLNVLSVLQGSFPNSKFCRNRPIQIAHVSSEDWARVIFWDRSVCIEHSEGDPYAIFLKRAPAGAWAIVCQEHRGDLPEYEHYSKLCAGMSKEAYGILFGLNAAATTAPPPATAPAATPKALADGSAALKRKDYPTALQLLQPLAEQGDPKAQELVGEMNEHGWGIAADGAEALKWYRKAADQGDVLAQNSLGFMYLTGSGVTKNGAEALKWYRKAADQGNAEAQFNLGQMYGDDVAGAAKDTTEAAKWHRKAADQGYAFAQYFLGEDYAEGRGVPKDDAEALKWYRKAADQGIEPAKTALAQLTTAEVTKVAARSRNDFANVKVTQFFCDENQSILRIDSSSVDDSWVSTREALGQFGAFSVNLLYEKCNGNPGRSRIIFIEGAMNGCSSSTCLLLSLENGQSLLRWGGTPEGVKYTFNGEEWYAADQENVYWRREKEKIAQQQLVEQQKLESDKAQRLRAAVNSKRDIAGFTTGGTIDSLSEARNCTQLESQDNTVSYRCPSGEITLFLAGYLNPSVVAIVLLEFCDPKQGPVVAADVAQQFGILQFPWILHSLGPSAEGQLDSDKHLILIPAHILPSLAPGQASSIDCPVNFNRYSLELIDNSVIQRNTKAKVDQDHLLMSTPTQKF